jgi:hypothetical protein
MTRTRWLVVAIVAFGVSCTIAGLTLLAASWSAPVPDSWGFRGFTTIFATGFGGAGANLAFRRPKNRIGWVLLFAGTASAIQVLAEEYAIYGVLGRETPLPGAVFAGWLESWMWLVGVVPILIFTLLLFPTGTFVSPRWRIVGWLAVIDGAIGVFCLALVAGPMNNAPFIDNPYPLLAHDIGQPIWLGAFIGVMFLAIASAASQVVRYRRAAGVERQQLKWLALEGGVLAVTTALTAITQIVAPEAKLPQVIFIFSIALMPPAIGIAVLRYRLYDIDVIINRAIVYGATTAAIGAAFVAGIVVLQSALRPVTGGSEVAVAASTLLCFALFQPIRRSVQATVDRRFYRSRYDATLTLDRFTNELAGEVDLDAVGNDLADAVGATMRPAHVSLWLRKRSS